MKAVLVAGSGDDKLYYILDAGPSEPDFAIEKPDGSVMLTNWLEFCSKGKNINKIRNTRFHRALWGAPKNIAKGVWYETFIEKSRPINDSYMEDLIIHTSLGKNKKKLQQKNDSVNKFITTKILNNCCPRMVKLDDEAFYYKSSKERKEAWTAMVLLRQLEEGSI